jgi:N-acetylated-alpha-linked acidic dipeptidase
MTHDGWKPKRTILLAFWDGEEFGLIGSTEWMEKHAAELDQKLVAYLNADSTGKGRFTPAGSHSLEAFMREVERDVDNPATGKPLDGTEPNRPFHIGALGSGSDYTPFLQHLGIASLDLRFAADDAGIYHSDYDDFDWFSHFSDTTFAFGRALSEVHITALMRLAGAPVLPFEFERFASTVRGYAGDIESAPSPAPKPDLAALNAEIARLQKTAGDLDAAWARALPRFGTAQPAKLAALNRILFRTERTMAADPGLPGRPWYRHHIYAPGLYTGYAVKTLPGLREAIEAGDTAEARQQAGQLVRILRDLDAQLAQAAAALGQI